MLKPPYVTYPNFSLIRKKYETVMRQAGRKPRKKPWERKQILAQWKSDLTIHELALIFRVTSKTICRWVRKYGLNCIFQRKVGEIRALASYPVRASDEGGAQITFPRFIVKRLGLKVGDKIRFELKKDKCLLRKEMNKKKPTDKLPAKPLNDEGTGESKPKPKKLLRGREKRIGKEHILVGWRSDLTADALAALFGVARATVTNWAQKYGLDYDYWGKLSRRSYALQQTGRRGYKINIPQYVVNSMNLKAGDRLRFELKKNDCILSKGK